MELIDWLMTNRIVIALLFIIGTFVTLIDFFKNGSSFFKKKINLPIWAILLIIGLTYWLSNFSNKKGFVDPKDYKEIRGEVFGEQLVDITNKRFVRCKFVNSTFVITGKGGADLTDIDVVGTPKFSFEGSAAGTLRLLIMMYKQPAFRPSVEELFERIKKDSIPLLTPLNDKVDLVSSVKEPSCNPVPYSRSIKDLLLVSRTTLKSVNQPALVGHSVQL